MTTTIERIVKQNKLGRYRTSRVQREAMLAEYDGSGMSGPEYAEYIGVKYPTFATWLQRRNRGAGVEVLVEDARAQSPMKWVEAVVEKESEQSSEGVVIRLRGGEEMTIRDEGGVKLAVELLRHLGGAKGC